ncbi:MAG TPA: bile acid:sodium symporter [Anaerolineae bacterium]|nr:bile acid:sodium symporter [Anaerolineae bacterium]
MSETLTIIAQLAGLVFVVGSMLAMGLSLTVAQIAQPLKNVRLVVLALVANFIVAPALVYGITAVIPVSEGQRIGLILLGTAAGAPFLPKLAQAAKGNIAFAVGLMVLLMVVTVVFLPLVLPLLLTGVEVNPLDIASSLTITMLIPLGIGLFVKARYPDLAQSLQPTFAQASNTSLLLMMGIMLTLNVRNILSVIGTGTIFAGVIFLIATFLVGYLLGGSDGDTKSVMGLGTGQRNISAALVVAGQNFTDPDVLITLIVIAIIGLVILMPIAGELGKRKEATAVA